MHAAEPFRQGLSLNATHGGTIAGKKRIANKNMKWRARELVSACEIVSGGPPQPMMTQGVSTSEQGELQGAMSSMRGLAMIFGPVIVSTTFAACIAQGRSFPAGPWYLAAFILLVALTLAVKVTGRAEIVRSSEVAQEPSAT